MGKFGSFAGGAAKGIQAGSGIAQQRGKLQLQQQAQQQKQQQDLLDQANKRVNDAVTQSGSIMELAHKKAALNPAEAASILDGAKKAVGVLESMVSKINTNAGNDPAVLQSRFTNIRESIGISGEQKIAATGAGLKVGAEAGARVEAAEGKPFMATSILDPKKQAPVTLKGGRYLDQQGVPINVDEFKITRIPGIEAATIEAATGLTKKEVVESRADLEEARVSIDAMSQALRDVKETPGASGFRGILADKVGGVLGQLPAIGGTLESAFTQAVAGASPEEVNRVRTQGRLAVAQNLSAITGEESGRFTEPERQIAEQVLGTLQPGASIAQITTAMKIVMELSLDAEIRESEKLGKPMFNLSSDEGVNKFGNYLIDLGFSENEALDMVRERKRRISRRQ